MDKITKVRYLNYDVTKNLCVCCGDTTDNSVRISEEGFVSCSYSVNVCPKHMKTELIGSSWFTKVNGELFYEYNSEYGMFGYLRKVDTKREFEYYKNKKEYEFLEDIYLE